MTIFVAQGDMPLSDSQLSKRTQANIDLSWPSWKRERSMRKADGKFDTYMASVALDTDTNRATNLFNTQSVAYTLAVARLAKYKVADGQAELTEMQATGEQTFNEETMEMDDVLESVVTKQFIEAVEPTVDLTTYDMDGEATVETITNPLITTDVAEREAAQVTIDATPQAVKDA